MEAEALQNGGAGRMRSQEKKKAEVRQKMGKRVPLMTSTIMNTEYR